MHVITNDFLARSSLQDFDLSWNKSFRALNLYALSIVRTPTDGSPDTTTFLKHVLSTIVSSVLIRIIVIYLDCDFCVECRGSDRPSLRELSQAERKGEASMHHRRFEVLRKVREVRDFRLILCASVWGFVGESPVQVLEEAIAEEKANGGFDRSSRKPLAIYNPHRVHQCYRLLCFGVTGELCQTYPLF